MRPGRRRPVVLLLIPLLLWSCASTLIVTGESLDATYQQFKTTAETYNHLLDAKAISVEDYRAWAAFAKTFTATFPAAVAGWKAARAANDGNALKATEQTIAILRSNLTGFLVKLTAKKGA